MRRFHWILLLSLSLTFGVLPGASAVPNNDRWGQAKKAECSLGEKPGKGPKADKEKFEQVLCVANSGAGIVRADFNNDGFSDLAVGIPGEDLPSATGAILENAGAVDVMFGSAAGLNEGVSDQFIRQGQGNLGTLEAGDQFGSALAAADFNGDGFDDLAVGSPFEDFATTGSSTLTDDGVVHWIPGRPGGLSVLNALTITQANTLIEDNSEAGDRFGYSLTWGDFGKSAQADLAIGVPGESVTVSTSVGPVTVSSAGGVNVLYGAAGGPTTEGDQFFTQNTSSVPDSAEPFDGFGTTLTAADFGRSPQADLVVGVPGEDLPNAAGTTTVSNAGAVNILYGGSTQIATTNSELWHQNNAGGGEFTETDDRFASALTAGDFNKDGKFDLAVGVPREDVFDLVAEKNFVDAGTVNVIRGSATGLTASGAKFLKSIDPTEAGDQFGFSLAANDFNGDTFTELAVGVPLEDLFGLPDVGLVEVFRNQLATGFRVSQERPFFTDTNEPGDQFGYAVSAWNFNGDEEADLAVGAPFEDLVLDERNRSDAGGISVYYGCTPPELLCLPGAQFWTQAHPDVADNAEEGDQFGSDMY